MATPYQELRDKMSPENQLKAAAKTTEMLIGLHHAELRKALALTQTEIAERIGVSQAMISKVEAAQDNILIETMRKYIEGLGADLVITARFPDMDIPINPAMMNRKSARLPLENT